MERAVTNALDSEMLVQLRELMGDDFHALVAAFLKGSAECMKDVEAAFAASDHERLRRAAHALKGMCLNMGAQSLAKALAALEAAARAGDGARLAPLWQTVCREYPPARAEAEALAGR
jgi:HPt (histidine-containing phosphotransfer) domain-containing protein